MKNVSVEKFKKLNAFIRVFAFFQAILFSGSLFTQTITIDGNPADWPAVLNNSNIPVKIFTHDAAKSFTDNEFSLSSKDIYPISQWGWQSGSVIGIRDIENAGAALINNDLYFFGDRVDTTVELMRTTVGVWFLLDPVAPAGTSPGGFTGSHSVGDILVLFEIGVGYETLDLSIYEWVGDGGSEQDGTLNFLGTTTNAAVNNVERAVPAYPGWTSQGLSGPSFYAKRSFFEGYINVENFTNKDFKSFLIETRSTMEITGSLFDFSVGEFGSSPQSPIVFIGNYSTVELGCNPTPFSISNALGYAIASDACSPITVTSSDGPIQSNGCQRSQTRTFNATDGCGFTASKSRTVNWTYDITPPVIIGDYSTTSVGCNPLQATIDAALGAATASDACTGPTITASNGQLDFDGCQFSQTRIFTAIDACGNYASISRTVTWSEDQTPPTFTGSYASVFLGCNPSSTAIDAALGSATATDGCGIPILSSSDPTVVINGCIRTQTRIFTATDGCGNTSSKTRSVSWINDLVPPIFIGNYGTVNLGYDPSASDINNALGTATASDACSTVIIASISSTIQVTGCNREQTRTFTATDVCGNFRTISRTVEWKQGCELMVSIGDIAVLENTSTALVPVTLNYPSVSLVTVNYKTVNGTAKHPKDFKHTTGTITFSPGQTTQYISISIVGDNINEAEEEFTVLLTSATNVLIDNDDGKVTITESATTSTSNSKNVIQNENDSNAAIKLSVPNPQSKQQVLKFYGIPMGTFNVTLFDISGKRIADLKNYKNDFSLFILKPGLYFYQVQQKTNNNELKRTTGKLLITD